jgi:hypothetical protein
MRPVISMRGLPLSYGCRRKSNLQYAPSSKREQKRKPRREHCMTKHSCNEYLFPRIEEAIQRHRPLPKSHLSDSESDRV